MSKEKPDISSIEEIITEAQNGQMFILVDDEDRENEGDLIIPAQKADAQAINFMAKYGRGLICLALSKERVRTLGLPPMAQHNQSRHQTAFTVSIEAREGITTGISAADRAKTIAVAIDKNGGAESIATPGHIFPLEAREGGVLVRAGHTEAATDISRLSGLDPSAVICEIMNDDGTMARIPDLILFAREHNLKIGKIADLIEYRRKNDKLVSKVTQKQFISERGVEMTMMIYANNVEYAEHIALVKGDIDDIKSNQSNTLVRMHAIDILADILHENGNEKSNILQKAMQKIEKAEQGVMVLMRPARRDRLSAEILKKSPNAVNQNTENANQLRDYGIGAQILHDIGVRRMTLLTNSERNIVGLEGYGLEIIDRQRIG